MEIVKKNIVSILCGVVAIICVILIFYPFGGMYRGLVDDVQKSKATGDQLTRVRHEPRTWPTLSSKEEDHIPLTHFPTQATLDIGSQMTQSWTQQANDFLSRALAIQSRLQQLVPGSLPGVPGQTTLAFNFLDEYKKIFGVSSNPGTPVLLPPGGALGVLPGGMPPTETEITDEVNKKLAEIDASMPSILGGQITNQAEIDTAKKQAQEATADKMRQDVALREVVYLDPVQSFQPDAHIAANAVVAPGVNDIFTAQVGLWIQQEICRAIAETNSGAKRGVLDAPIKRLISIRLTLPYVAVNAPAGQAPGEPLIAPSLPAAHVPVDYTKNVLGHVNNEFYDVIPFQLSIICDADTLPTTMTNLTRGRFIMVRSMDVLSVDSAVAYAQGYIFGDKPVIQLNMRCQFLMLRKFLGPQMPQDIIRGLSAPAAPQ